MRQTMGNVHSAVSLMNQPQLQTYIDSHRFKIFPPVFPACGPQGCKSDLWPPTEPAVLVHQQA